MKTYKVICVESAPELEAAVNALLADGWELCGGMATDSWHGDDGRLYSGFYQAMIGPVVDTPIAGVRKSD